MSRYHLLSVGADPSILSTRTDVLKRAGFNVTATTSERDAQRTLSEENFDLIVICHSLPLSDRRKLMQAVRESKYLPKIVVINRSPEPEPAADASIHSLDGPDRLLECIAELLEEPK
jgi:DNA-binding response OmpR family regulator